MYFNALFILCVIIKYRIDFVELSFYTLSYKKGTILNNHILLVDGRVSGSECYYCEKMQKVITGRILFIVNIQN